MPSHAALLNALTAFQASAGPLAFHCVVCRDDRPLVAAAMRGEVVLVCPACGLLHRNIESTAHGPSAAAFRRFVDTHASTEPPER